MAAATDMHVQLMKWENRSYQQALMERAVSQDEALRRLTEMVEENGRKLDAIMASIWACRYKPPAGFVKE